MQIRLLIVVTMVVIACSVTAHSAIIHQSAILGGAAGEPPFSGNPAVSFSQFLGSRFSLTETVQVEQIGGHLVNESVFPGETIFGVIVSLQSSTALPLGGSSPFDPFDPNEVLASTTFVPPSPSADHFVPLSVTLGPGDYALIFGGGGLFGSVGGGSGAMPNNNVDIRGSASYFQWSLNLGPAPPAWRDNPTLANLRFVVTGSPVPAPSTMLLFGTGLVGLASWRWTTGKRTAPHVVQ